MREKIRIGVVGYGNLGKGVMKAIEKNKLSLQEEKVL